MAKLIQNEMQAYQLLLTQLKEQLDDLSRRCAQLDSSIKQTENHCFVFEIHLFSNAA